MATFRTEQAWGNLTQWHPAPNLNIDLTDGDNNEITAVSWQRADGSEGSISLQEDQTSFLGYYRKPNEGPIAYRGSRIS
ncbi:hypothetical protein EPA93_19905 [Ktedonosporobacter rubrisoli]|uniref:OAA-family lectin sugar binding domain-containing protein n=1 Tax=Ktedonosporobacter rubrisoli TaxID=2509675 RepID=A0A4P6JRN8_KTERU|nr:hypothetical protein [Ktedonosporobacter rubrisoli]QBD78138.1 hypothetical protein EPA93_19905 [Ktedonosporobacter rubrisoli]